MAEATEPISTVQDTKNIICIQANARAKKSQEAREKLEKTIIGFIESLLNDEDKGQVTITAKDTRACFYVYKILEKLESRYYNVDWNFIVDIVKHHYEAAGYKVVADCDAFTLIW